MKPAEQKYPPQKSLELWLSNAKPSIRNLLTELAHTSENMYRQWVKGRRGISAGKAGDLEAAMLELKARHPEAPEPLTRADLCDTCRRCPYFIAASKPDIRQ